MRRLPVACIIAFVVALSATVFFDHAAVHAWASPRGFSSFLAALHVPRHSASQRPAILSIAISRLVEDSMHSSQYLHPTMW